MTERQGLLLSGPPPFRVECGGAPSQHSAVFRSASVHLCPRGAAGNGCPCIRLTRMPVDEPKMLSISYSPSAGAGSPGSCSARSAIPCPRALRARECARAPWSGITHSLDLLRPTTQAACGSRRDHHLQACKLARNAPRLTFGPPSNYKRCRKDGTNACIGLCEP